MEMALKIGSAILLGAMLEGSGAMLESSGATMTMTSDATSKNEKITVRWLRNRPGDISTASA